MELVTKTDKKIFGEILLIIGGFMLADTLIKKFLELSDNKIPWWILPILSYLIITTGVSLKEDKVNIKDIISLFYLLIPIILLVLALNNILSIWWFVGVSIIFGILSLIFWIKSRL